MTDTDLINRTHFPERKDKITPPNNLAAEAAVLGAILFDNNEFDRVREILRPDDFFASAHQLIFQHAVSLIETGQTADGITMGEWASETAQVRDAGGAGYLMQLLDSAAFGVEVTDYSVMIRDMAARRLLMMVGAELHETGRNPAPGERPSDWIERARDELHRIEDRAVAREDWEDASASAEAAVDKIEEMLRTGVKPGVRCGIKAVDEFSGGFHAGDLIVLAGASSMGKTSSCVNLATGMARQGKKVGFFSQEMTREQLAWRAMSADARRLGKGRIEYEKIRKGQIGQNEVAILRDAAKRLPKTLKWNAIRSQSVASIAAGCRSVRRQLGGLDAVFIDYLQIMDRDLASSRSTADLTGLVTQKLKALAGDLGVPVFVLSQVNRSVDTREDHRPRLADLRDSGSIEQDADTVIFVYRDSYYAAREAPPEERPLEVHEKHAQRVARARNKIEWIFAKQRMGPTGTVELYFEPETDLILNSKDDLPGGDGFKF
mgnify:CR=1 FL=1